MSKTHKRLLQYIYGHNQSQSTHKDFEGVLRVDLTKLQK